MTIFQKLIPLILTAVICVLSYFSATPTDAQQTLQIAINKDKTVAQCGELLAVTPKQEVIEAMVKESSPEDLKAAAAGPVTAEDALSQEP